MNKYEPSAKSPYWGSTTKIVVGVAAIAALGALAFYLRPIIGPLLLSFILSYLLLPVVQNVQRTLRTPWSVSVTVVYLILIVLLIAFFAITGFALIQQVQSLYSLANAFIRNLPEMIASLPGQMLVIGPFQYDMSHTDAQTLSKQVLDNISPLLGQTGGVLGTVASQTLNFFGWLSFIVLISYFILSETRQEVPQGTSPYLEFPGYNYDFYRLGRELERTWNSFLRGQIMVVLLTAAVTSLLYTGWGVKYALALGLLAGLARFVPYLGQFTYMVTAGLVCYFQGGNYLGLSAEAYTGLVLGSAFLLDVILDNLVAVRILGRSLGLHPAAILVTALIGTRVIGFTGLILAAPVLATLRILGRYVTRKMFNQDPWLEPDVDLPPLEYPWQATLQRIEVWITDIIAKKRTR